MVEDLLRHYSNTSHRDLIEVNTRLAHLNPYFNCHRASKIDAALVERYVEQRKRAAAANGTINRELGLLMRMFKLAMENRRVATAPVIRKLKEAAPRQGFFERDSSRPSRAGSRKIFRWRLPSPTHSAGGQHRARC